MPRRIEPPPSRARALYPDADPEVLAWIAEKARRIIDHGPANGVGWDWIELSAEGDLEPAPENEGPAYVFGGIVINVEGGGESLIELRELGKVEKGRHVDLTKEFARKAQASLKAMELKK